MDEIDILGSIQEFKPRQPETAGVASFGDDIVKGTYSPDDPLASIQDYDPRLSREEYVDRTRQAAVRLQVGTGREDNAAAARRQLQSRGISPDALGKDFDVELEGRRMEVAGEMPGGIGRQLERHVTPFADLWDARDTKGYHAARERLKAGQATDDDVKTIAEYDRLNAIDHAATQTTIGAIGHSGGSILKTLGEFAAGGPLSRVALKGAGMGVRALGLGRGATQAAPTVAEAAAQALTKSTGRKILDHAGRMAAITPFVPSMYVQEARERNMAAGLAPDDIAGYPKAVAHAYANMLVLGSLQHLGNSAKTFAGQIGTKAGLGLVEQAAADVYVGLAEELLTKEGAAGGTRFGVLGKALFEGEWGEAAHDAAVQLWTFGVFAGMHGKQGKAGKPDPQKARDTIAAGEEVVEALKKQGLGRDKSVGEFQVLVKKLEGALDAATKSGKDLTRAEAKKLFEGVEDPRLKKSIEKFIDNAIPEAEAAAESTPEAPADKPTPTPRPEAKPEAKPEKGISREARKERAKDLEQVATTEGEAVLDIIKKRGVKEELAVELADEMYERVKAGEDPIEVRNEILNRPGYEVRESAPEPGKEGPVVPKDPVVPEGPEKALEGPGTGEAKGGEKVPGEGEVVDPAKRNEKGEADREAEAAKAMERAFNEAYREAKEAGWSEKAAIERAEAAGEAAYLEAVGGPKDAATLGKEVDTAFEDAMKILGPDANARAIFQKAQELLGRELPEGELFDALERVDQKVRAKQAEYNAKRSDRLRELAEEAVRDLPRGPETADMVSFVKERLHGEYDVSTGDVMKALDAAEGKFGDVNKRWNSRLNVEKPGASEPPKSGLGKFARWLFGKFNARAASYVSMLGKQSDADIASQIRSIEGIRVSEADVQAIRKFLDEFKIGETGDPTVIRNAVARANAMDKGKPLPERIDAAAARAEGLTPTQQKLYAAMMKNVVSRMPEEAQKRFNENLTDLVFAKDVKTITLETMESWRTYDPEGFKEQDGDRIIREMEESGSTAMGFATELGQLVVDGLTTGSGVKGKFGQVNAGGEGTYAHEVGHIIDGPNYGLSSTARWKQAYEAEIRTTPESPVPKLTEYAGRDHFGKVGYHEGFAEFARLLYGSNISTTRIAKEFPQSSKFFKDMGLWPKERKSGKTTPEFDDIFDTSLQMGGTLGDARSRFFSEMLAAKTKNKELYLEDTNAGMTTREATRRFHERGQKMAEEIRLKYESERATEEGKKKADAAAKRKEKAAAKKAEPKSEPKDGVQNSAPAKNRSAEEEAAAEAVERAERAMEGQDPDGRRAAAASGWLHWKRSGDEVRAGALEAVLRKEGVEFFGEEGEVVAFDGKIHQSERGVSDGQNVRVVRRGLFNSHVKDPKKRSWLQERAAVEPVEAEAGPKGEVQNSAPAERSAADQAPARSPKYQDRLDDFRRKGMSVESAEKIASAWDLRELSEDAAAKQYFDVAALKKATSPEDAAARLEEALRVAEEEGSEAGRKLITEALDVLRKAKEEPAPTPEQAAKAKAAGIRGERQAQREKAEALKKEQEAKARAEADAKAREEAKAQVIYDQFAERFRDGEKPEDLPPEEAQLWELAAKALGKDPRKAAREEYNRGAKTGKGEEATEEGDEVNTLSRDKDAVRQSMGKGESDVASDVADFVNGSGLTAAESRTVLARLGGLTNKAIAERDGVKESTIEKRVSAAFKKMKTADAGGLYAGKHKTLAEWVKDLGRNEAARKTQGEKSTDKGLEEAQSGEDRQFSPGAKNRTSKTAGAKGGAKSGPPPSPRKIAKTVYKDFGLPHYEEARPEGGREDQAAYEPGPGGVVQGKMTQNAADVAIHEAAHHLTATNKWEADPKKLPADVREGLKQFDYDAGRKGGPATRIGMIEGMAEWFRRRAEGDLDPATLTPEMRAAAEHMEKLLARKPEQLAAADRHREMVSAWLAADAQAKARGLMSGSTEQVGPEQTRGDAARELAGDFGRLTQEQVFDNLAALRRMEADVNAARKARGMKELPPEELASTKYQVLMFKAGGWAAEFGRDGVKTLDNGAMKKIGLSDAELLGDAKPEWYTPERKGETTKAGLFVTARHVLMEARRGFRDKKAANRKIREARKVADDPKSTPEQKDAARAKRREGAAERKRAVARTKLVPAETLRVFREAWGEMKADREFYRWAVPFAKRFTDANNAMLRGLAAPEVHRLSPEFVEQLIADRPEYAPIMRVVSDPSWIRSTGASKGERVKRLIQSRTGGGETILDPLVSYHKKKSVYANALAEQIKMNSLMLLKRRADEVGVGAKYAMEAGSKEPIGPEAKRALQEAIRKEFEGDPNVEALIESLGLSGDPSLYASKPWPADPNKATKDWHGPDGRVTNVRVRDRQLYDLLTNQQVESSSVAKLFNTLARMGFTIPKVGRVEPLGDMSWLVRNLATSLSPAFQVWGSVRDVKTFLANTSSGLNVVKNLKDLAKSYGELFKASFQILRGKSVDNPLVKYFLDQRGDHMKQFAFDPARPKAVAPKEVRSVWGVARDFVNMLNSPELAPRYLEFVNTLTRLTGKSKEQLAKELAEADAAVGRGEQASEPVPFWAMVEAMNRAHEVTVPFGRLGVTTREINKITPFFGPMVTSWNKAVRNFRENPQGAALGLGLLVAAKVAHWAAVSDEEWYKSLDPYQKYNNYVFEAGGQLYRIPGTRDVDVPVGGLVTYLLDSAADKNPDLRGLVRQSLDEMTPPAPLPVPAKAAWDLARNKNFMGRDIVPKMDEDLPDWDKATKYQIPYAAEQVTAGRSSLLYDPSAKSVGLNVAKPVTARREVNDFYARLKELSAEELASRRSGVKFPQKAELEKFRKAQEEMTRLNHLARGDKLVGKRWVGGEPPGDAERKKILAKQVALARRVLGED
ncbi:MAG TPA: LPD38 domain-containing protein [Gemmata sp.]|nr:LPD38 domain-containing protein [Gemmata sp.]